MPIPHFTYGRARSLLAFVASLRDTMGRLNARGYVTSTCVAGLISARGSRRSRSARGSSGSACSGDMSTDGLPWQRGFLSGYTYYAKAAWLY